MASREQRVGKVRLGRVWSIKKSVGGWTFSGNFGVHGAGKKGLDHASNGALNLLYIDSYNDL